MKPAVIFYSIFAVIFASSSAFAAGGDPHHIPTKLVLLQLLNFGLFVTVLFLLLKDKVRSFYTTRKEDFTAAKRKAEIAQKEAQEKQREIRERLDKLEVESANTIEKAQKEAEALRAKMLQEAQELSARLKSEAEKSTQFAIERAKEELRTEMLDEAVEAARKVISGNIGEPDQQRLKNEFVDKIQVVRQ